MCFQEKKQKLPCVSVREHSRLAVATLDYFHQISGEVCQVVWSQKDWTVTSMLDTITNAQKLSCYKFQRANLSNLSVCCLRAFFGVSISIEAIWDLVPQRGIECCFQSWWEHNGLELLHSVTVEWTVYTTLSGERGKLAC